MSDTALDPCLPILEAALVLIVDLTELAISQQATIESQAAQLVEATVEISVLTDELAAIRLDALNILRLTQPPRPAATAILTIQGEDPTMPASLTVDTTGKKLVLTFLDDHGDTDATPPVGADGQPAVIGVVNDNPAALTLTAVDSQTQDITVVAENLTANIGFTINDTAGNPILEADGVTPFAPALIAVNTLPGGAISASDAIV